MYSPYFGWTIHITNANLNIKNCLFINNTSGNGGVIAADYSTVTIQNTTITNNRASLGGQ
ncbi:hypothetical protein [Methanothermobacter marburgensis]|uniref:hypothetical protein n=1 Tax=Methanothermobacter marburgensis TaxID=145263 RepID=UPI0035BC165D